MNSHDAYSSLPSGADAKGASVATTEALASQRSLLQQSCGGRGLPQLLPYSSTEVRNHIAAGHDTSHMLHPDVAQYIREKHLYQG